MDLKDLAWLRHCAQCSDQTIKKSTEGHCLVLRDTEPDAGVDQNRLPTGIWVPWVFRLCLSKLTSLTVWQLPLLAAAG